MPAVSIVTTTLNRTHYLNEAIQSALSQTFSDFELLVCDDGGREETRALCESFQDPRIRHIVNDARLGLAMNTYSGVMKAGSPLIAFLNDDDRWTENFLASCMPPLQNDSSVVVAFSDHWLIDAEGRRLPQETDKNSVLYGRTDLPAGRVQDPLRLLVAQTIPIAMASVFRKSAVDWTMYSANVEGSYDYFLSYCLIRSGGKIVYVPQRLTEYRTHGGSATAKFQLSNTQGAAFIDGLILRDPLFRGVREDLRLRCVGLERHSVKLSLLNLDLFSAVRHFGRWVQYRFSSFPS